MGDVLPFRPRAGAEPWLNKRQAAAHLGVVPRTITNWQRDADLPFRAVRGVNLYRASELDRWVERQHAAATLPG